MAFGTRRIPLLYKRPPAGGAPAWSPLDLGVKLRAWWDYTDTANLWQNTDGTGAVSADTDPVGRVSDKSGNGHHLIEATNKPAYRTSPGRVRFDGSNDKLSIAAPAFPIDVLELFQVVQQHNTATGSQGLYSFAPSSGSDWNTTGGCTVNLSNDSNYIVFEANSTNMTVGQAGSGNAPKALYETSKTATVASLLVNGSPVATDSSFTALSSTHNGNFLDACRLNGGSISLFAPIDRWETVLTAELTSDERTSLRAYLMGRHGL